MTLVRPWQLSDADLRAMYAGGRANRAARRFARWWIRVINLGILPRRWVVLEVPGRQTGTVTRFPLGMADNQWYLLSMLGENCKGRRTQRCRRLERDRQGHGPHAAHWRGDRRSRARAAVAVDRDVEASPCSCDSNGNHRPPFPFRFRTRSRIHVRVMMAGSVGPPSRDLCPSRGVCRRQDNTMSEPSRV